MLTWHAVYWPPTSGAEGVVGGKREAAQLSLRLLLAVLGFAGGLRSSGKKFLYLDSSLFVTFYF